MLFQGQEFWASAPFRYFADHRPELAKLVRAGRHAYLALFPSLSTRQGQAQLPDPEAEATFDICKLDWAEADRNAAVVAMHRDLLQLRRTDAAFDSHHRPAVDGSVVGPEALALRFFAENGEDRLLIVNLGRDHNPSSIADPLMAPPRDRRWAVLWSSEDPRYGGTGTPPIDFSKGWHIPGHTAVVLTVGAESGEVMEP